MSSSILTELADSLTQARLSGKSRPQLHQDHKLTRTEAYKIQEMGIEHRIQRQEKFVGYKMGLTSAAKRKQMNLDSPLYGVLTDKMQVQNSSTFLLQGSIHPKIEPEVAFLINRELRGKVSREQVLSACESVCACMEILDSRYDQFKYFSMEDVIADNSSSSHFVLGPWKKDFHQLDLALLKMKMSVNGQTVQEGNSKDISGDPVISVMQLCELLAERGRSLPAGSIVLAGAATAAVALEVGQKIELEVEGLPPLSVNVKS